MFISRKKYFDSFNVEEAFREIEDKNLNCRYENSIQQNLIFYTIQSPDGITISFFIKA